MSGSIRETVSFGNAAEADEAALRQALAVACADEFVQELPNGLDTVIGERGVGLTFDVD